MFGTAQENRGGDTVDIDAQGMRDIGITWDVAQLTSYLANPRAMAPGTTMTVAVPPEADRANIGAYLQGLTATN